MYGTTSERETRQQRKERQRLEEASKQEKMDELFSSMKYALISPEEMIGYLIEKSKEETYEPSELDVVLEEESEEESEAAEQMLPEKTTLLEDHMQNLSLTKVANASKKEQGAEDKISNKSKGITASKSVVTHLDDEGLSISGRAPTKLPGIQGDHVTALALIERGFKRLFLKEQQSDDENKSRTLKTLREGRAKTYNFISAIAALDVTRKDNLDTGVNIVLGEYNAKRFHKSFIEEIKGYIEKSNQDISIKNEKTKKVDGIKSANIPIIRESISKMTRTILTFYNKIPETAFMSVKGFEAPIGEGGVILGNLNHIEKFCENDLKYLITRATNKEQKSLKTIEEDIDNSDNDEEKSQLKAKYQEILFQGLITNMAKTFFYPEIDESAIENQKINDIAERKAKKKPLPTDDMYRDNNANTLALAIGKHLHILFAVYPELEEVSGKNRDEISQSFIENVIIQPYKIKNPYYAKDAKKGTPESQQNIENPCGWPSLQNLDKSDIKYIELLNGVKEKMQELCDIQKQPGFHPTATIDFVPSSSEVSSGGESSHGNSDDDIDEHHDNKQKGKVNTMGLLTVVTKKLNAKELQSSAKQENTLG